MKMIKSCLVLTFCAFLVAHLTACQTSYSPVGDYGGFPHGGYTDSLVNSNTAIVSFIGNSFTSTKNVKAYLLYRCAKVTLENGFDYFIVMSSSNSPVTLNAREAANNNQNMIEPPTLHRTYYYGNDFMAYSTNITPMEGFEEPANKCKPNSGPHTASSVIKMYHGHVPRGVPRAYNALDVVAHLEPAIER